MSDANDELWYPTVEDILRLHEDIIREDSNATPGVEEEERIGFVIDYVQHGHFGQVPGTIHEKAFHLMRLLASNHWFVDGNKRTALNTTELFYLVNGYELDYGEDIRSMLKLFSVRETLIDQTAGPKYLKDQTSPVEIDDDIDPWAAVIALVAVTAAKYPDIDEHIPEEEDRQTMQEGFGLTLSSDGTINNDGDEGRDKDGS